MRHLVWTSSSSSTSSHGCCVTHCPNSLIAESGMGRWVLVTAERWSEVVGAGVHRIDRCVLRPMGGSGFGYEYCWLRSVMIRSRVECWCVGKSTTWVRFSWCRMLLTSSLLKSPQTTSFAAGYLTLRASAVSMMCSVSTCAVAALGGWCATHKMMDAASLGWQGV